MQELISVIVPIYKVERYLRECLDTICGQTYKNLEIILVDDGSPDNCGKICDEYSQKDTRIKVIHKKNAGVAEARNSGLDAANGRYISFIDPDDLVKPTMLEQLYSLMKEYDAQVSMCGFCYYEDGKQKDVFQEDREKLVISGIDAQYRYFENYQKSLMYSVVWNKLFDRNLFLGLRYPKGKIHEDEYLNFQLLYQAGKMVCTSEILYLYRIVRKESIMDYFNANRFQLFDAYLIRMKFYKEKQEKDLWIKTFKLYLHMFEQYVQWQKEKGDKKQNYIIKKYREKLKVSLKNSGIVLPAALKIEYVCSAYIPIVYHALWKIKNYFD